MTTQSFAACPVCGEGHLHSKIDSNEVTYKDVTRAIALHYSVCDECGSEQAGEDEARLNKREMMSFRKQVDGLLSGAEIRAIRNRLHINQAEAARIFGGGPVAFSKYENDDVAQSESMDKLLRVADAVPSAFFWLAHQAGEVLAAARAQLEQFQQWQMTSSELMMPALFAESFRAFERHSAVVTMGSPANHNDYLSQGVVG